MAWFLDKIAAKPQAPHKMFAQLQTMYVTLAALRADNRADDNPLQDIAIGFILVAISLVLALVIFPVVADAVAFSQASTNVTGSTDTILGLIPLILAVILLFGAVAFLVRGFRGLRAN